MKISYIVHNLNDPAVERRCVMLERGGAVVRLAGFCREEVLSPAISKREPLLLGRSHDGAMAQRALATLSATFLNAELTKFFDSCDVVIARNLEQLAIACNVKQGRPLVYECLDIHHTLVGTGLASKMVQLLESKLLPQVDLLLTSSPAFVERHFAKTTLSAQIKLIENKLLVNDVDAFPQPSQLAADTTICIGWFGMLRCARTLAVLKRMVREADGALKVLIAGKPSPAVFDDFGKEIAGETAISFTGAYAYSDLPRLYGACHFAWTIDWFEEGENSSWLLPNRIYEAIAHGCVPIALANIEVGRWLHQRRVGLLLDVPDKAGSAISGMSHEELTAMQEAVREVPRRDVLADDDDCRDLVSLLATVVRR